MRISWLEEAVEFQNKILFVSEKQRYLPHFWSNKGFKGTVVNCAVPPECGGYGSTKMFIFSNNIYPVPRCSNYLSDNMNGNEFMVLKFK